MLTLIRCPFHPRVTAVVRKRPRSFRQKRRWQTHTPLTQRSRSGLTMPLSGHSVGTLSGNELTCNSSGNTRSQSSQLAEPLWTEPGLKSGINERELISTLKKKAQAGNELLNILPKSSHSRKKPPVFFFFLCSLIFNLCK